MKWIEPTFLEDMKEMNKRRAKYIDKIMRKQYPELFKPPKEVKNDETS